MSGFTRSQSWGAWCTVAAGLLAVLAASGTVHGQGQEAAGTVDDARLLAAGDQDDRNWITFGQDYSNQRFSALTQINRDNVRGLVPAWIFQTGVVGSFQTTPLVVDGVMYITTPGNNVAAVDAATGERIWHYRHAMRSQPFGALSNRGAGIGYGKVYEASDDGRLIALDQATGEVVWDVVIARPEEGETEKLAMLGPQFADMLVSGTSRLGAKMPPLVYEGKVIVGVTGAGYGLHFEDVEGRGDVGVAGIEGNFGKRGYVAAYDAETGTELGRWYTTKEHGWEGPYAETTPDGIPLNRDIAAEKAVAERYREAWRSGGGSTWMTPSLDPEMGLIFLGTGNASPQNYGFSRPGDNLYTMSVVALDVATGELRWYYQQVPHEVWGYDVASQTVLFDVPLGGRKVPAVGQASKTGWFYVNDRATGELLFKSEAFVPQMNMFSPPTPEGVLVAPGAAGGASWSPVSYDPNTGVVYIAAIHGPSRYSVVEAPAEGDRSATRYTLLEEFAGGEGEAWGTLTAIDTRNGGKIRWQVRTDQILVGGVLATAGGLVFMGEGSGDFDAFDADTGKLLWRFQTGAGVNAPPIAYAVDGRQYVAVASGGSRLFGFQAGDALIAFALPEGATDAR
jgi:alcohol dehydrogenase (cytochrome c)